MARWNENLEAMTGRSREQLLDCDVLEILAEGDRVQGGIALGEAIITGIAHAEVRMLGKGGVMHWIRWQIPDRQ